MGLTVDGMAPLIQVFDMPTSVAFYRDVLGFEILTTSPPRGRDDFDWAWLRLDGVDVMLNTAYEEDTRPHQPDASRLTAHGDTCFFFGCRDVDAAYEELRSQGIDLQPPKIAPYGMKQLYFNDPDGFSICLQWRVDEPTEKRSPGGTS